MIDKRDELYNNLLGTQKTDVSELGTVDQFRSAVKDERTARQLYRNLKGIGKLTEAEIGTEDQFYNSISGDFSDTPAFGIKISDSVLSPEFKRGNEKTDDEVQYNTGTPTIDEQRKKLSDFEAENKDFTDELDGIRKKGAKSHRWSPEVVASVQFQKQHSERIKDIEKRRDELWKAIDTHPDEEAWRKDFSSAAAERLKFSEEKERGLTEEHKKLPFTDKIWRDDKTMELGREVDNFITARALYKRAGGMIDAPSKHGGGSGFSNFLKGGGNAATDEDVWSMGITSIIRDYKVGGVLKKLGENKEGKDLDLILTPGEQEVLRAMTALKTAESSRSHDLSLGYSAGQGAVNSVPYIAEFLLTGGIAAAASKAATGAVSRWLVKNTLSKGLAREALKGVAWGTKAGIETLVRTPLMPSTYKNISSARIGTDDNGLPELKSWGEAIKQGGIGSFIDNLGEASGAHIAGALGLAGKAAGKVVPKAVTELAGKLSTSRTRDMWKTFKNSDVTDFMKRAGYNGILEEAGEEWYSAALRSATIEPDALKNYATVDNQLVTVASFLPMALGGAGVSVAINMRNAARYRKSAANLEDLLKRTGMDATQAASLKTELADADTRRVSEILTPIVNKAAGSDPEFGKQVFQVVRDYMCSRNISSLSEGALRDRVKEDEDGNKILVLDETDKGSLVESEDGSKKFVVSSRLKDVEDVGSHAAESVASDMQPQADHIPGDIAMFNGQPVTIQRVELDGSVIVENQDGTVEQVEAGDLIPHEKPGGAVNSAPAQEVPSDADVAQQENTQQETPLAEKAVPLTKAGKPDYNAMLAADPELFATEWEKRSTPEEARAALEKQSGNIGTRIKSLQKKLDTETDFNKIAGLEDEISALEQQREKIDRISQRYVEEVDEVVAEGTDIPGMAENPENIKPAGKGFFGLLTTFEKETPVSIDRTTDIGENRDDLQNDTAPLQDIGISSENKDTHTPAEKQESGAPTEEEQAEIEQAVAEMREERGEYRDGGEIHGQDDEGTILFREAEGMKQVNDRFNEGVDHFTEDNALGTIFSLGNPSECLLSAGVVNKPIRLYGSKVLKKMKKHGFKIEELRDLPNAVADPIAVFNNVGRKGNRSVLTNLKTANGNFLVTVDLGKGTDADFDVVSSVFGKSDSSVLSWINNGLATYIDKEKALDYLRISAPIAEASNSQGLSSATNIVENFVNPTVLDGEISSEIDRMGDELGIKVTKAKNRTDLPEGIQRQMKGGRYPGLYDPKTGRVYVVMDEITDVPDAQATVLHEILGHKGIRELFGTRLPEFCRRVLETIPEQQRSALFEKYAEGHPMEELSPGQQETLRQLAAEEYVASFAEGYTDPSAWEKIKAIIRDMLRSVGLDLKLSDNDLKYILWKARNGLREGDGLMETTRKIARDKEIGNILFRKDPDKNLSSEEFITKKRTTAELYRQQIVDSAVSVKRLTDHLRTRGTKIRDFEDAYSESLLADSKSHQAVKRYQEEYQHPLNEAIVALMKKSNKSFPDVCHYVIAKHAPERNGMIESRNGMKDGSGLSDVEAGELVRKFEDGCDQKDISELWKRINAATRFALERQRDDGFISGKMFDQISGMFSYYVPLKGWEETDGVDYTKSERHSPFSGNGRKARAEGRTSMADNPFAHIEMAAENAIRQGDQNYVRQCLYNMCVNNPDADLYSVSKTYYVEKDGEWIAQHERPDDSLFRSGKARTELAGVPHKDLIKTADAKRYDVDVWVGGEKRTITFAQGERGLDIADAINRARVVRPGRVSEVFGRATRFIASVNTSKNPEFIVRNFERDFLYAVPAYAIKGGNSFRLMANLPKAFRALNDEFMNGAGKENNQRNRYVDEYLGSGGKTGFVHSLSIESRRRKLTKEINRMRNSGTASGRAVAVGKAIGSTMEYLGDMSENSIRLAVFMTERESGKGIRESATAAKEITVNFNRKGNLTPVLGSYYAFFNASVQGSLYNFVGLGVKWTNRTIFASAVLGVIQLMAAWMSRWFGDDDELGVSGYDRLSDHTRNNNIILPDIMRVGKLFGWQNQEGQKYGFMTIPMPQSFRALSAAGIIADQVYRGNKSVARGMMEIADNLVANLSPLDLEFYNFSEGKPWMFAARSLPTVVQPFIDIIANRDFADRQIYRDEFLKSLEGKVPESSLGMKNTNGLFVSLAKAANRAANGTDNLNPELRVAGDGGVTRNGFMGWMDWNPAVMEHIVEGITGGGGRFWNNVYKTAEACFTEKEVDNSDIPFLRTHRTMPYRKTHWEMYFDLRDQVADVDFVAGANKKAGNYGTHIRVLTKSNQINNKVSFSYIDQVVKGMRDLSGMATTPEAKEIFLQQMDKTVLEWAKARKKAEKENPGKD